jgi:putative oxidoreductase
LSLGRVPPPAVQKEQRDQICERVRAGDAAVLSRSEDAALLLGRLFVAALFLPPGVSKLLAFPTYAAWLGTHGLPYPTLAAAAMVAAQLLGSMALILGAWPRATALVLVAFTAVTVSTAHRASLLGTLLNPRENGDFFRTLAIVGGLLFYFVSGPGRWSWKSRTARHRPDPRSRAEGAPKWPPVFGEG